MKTIKHYFIVLILSSLFFTSCATKINVNVTRPGQLDLGGAETIAVLPFTPYAYHYGSDYYTDTGIDWVLDIFFQSFDLSGTEERTCLSNLHSQIEDGLLKSQYIQVVSANAVQTAIKNGSINPADVYLTGEVTYFGVNDEVETTRRKISEGYYDEYYDVYIEPEYEIIKKFQRRVKMDFRYQVVESYSNKIISYSSFRLDKVSGYYNYQRDLPSVYSILEYDLKAAGQQILHELQPYEEIKSFVLMEDKSKNPDFKHANQLVKDGYLQEGYEEFYKIYQTNGLMAAGYNAAMIKAATGDLKGGEKEMAALYDRFNDKKILDALYDIRNELQQAEKLKNQSNKSDVLDVNFQADKDLSLRILSMHGTGLAGFS